MGLLDSVAYGLAGGVAGGAQAAEGALGELQKQNLQSELNQQTSDLHVAAEKQIADYSLAQKHGEQARVAAIITGDPGAKSTVAGPTGAGTNAPTPPPATPVPASPGTAAPNAASPTAPGAAPGGAPQPAAAPPVAAPNAAASPTGQPPADPDGDFVEGAQKRLLANGLIDEADKVGKMNDYTVAGSAWGKQVLLNKATGKYKVLDETGQRREASAEEIAQMRVEARNQGYAAGNAAHEAAAQKAYSDTIEKAPLPAAAVQWGTPSALGDKPPTPHPDVVEAYHTLSEQLFSTGRDPIAAPSMARQLTTQLADKANEVATSQKLTPGTPEFVAARDAAFHRGWQATVKALRKGGGSATPASKPATQTPGLLSSAQNDTATQ